MVYLLKSIESILLGGIAMDKKMLFVFNPQSGKGQIRNKLMDILDIFIKAGYHVEVHVTQKPLDARKVIIQRGEEMDIIVGSGGDGTLNEVVSGVMELSHKPKIGYIPTGTTNDFASSHKIPKDMLKAADIAVNGKAKPVDIGSLNERFFTYVATFGVFTDVPYTTPQETKAILGHAAYILEATKSLGAIKPSHIKMKADDVTYEGNVLVGIVSNSNSIGGFAGINGKDVGMDDGLFEVLLVEEPPTILEYPEMLTGLLSPDNKSRFIKRFKAADVTIINDEPVKWDLDGEFGGKRSEVHIVNRYRAVNIMQPKDDADELMEIIDKAREEKKEEQSGKNSEA